MKLIVISDLHFGDKECCFDRDRQDRFFSRLEAAGAFSPPADFIVLLGDIFDFSVASYAEAFDQAQPFFKALDGRIKDIIYVPGNHDGDFWHLIDNQINVLKPMEGGRPPRSLMMTCPAVLTDRPDGFDLHWVRPYDMHYQQESRRPERVGLFVDSLVTGKKNSDTLAALDRKAPKWAPRFWVAYPNLYLVNERETVLLTHGHYFETWWALGGEVASHLCRSCFDGADVSPELTVKRQDGIEYTSLFDTVGLNYPMSQLICSGLGQAGNLCQYAKAVQAQAKKHDMTIIDRLIKKLPAALSGSFISPRSGRWQRFWAAAGNGVADVGAALVNAVAQRRLGQVRPARGREDMFDTEVDEDRLQRYLLATGLEIDGLRRKFPELSHPTKLVFGHTHEPVADPTVDDFTGIEYLNCGGFVKGCGGGVAFVYENGAFSPVEV